MDGDNGDEIVKCNADGSLATYVTYDDPDKCYLVDKDNYACKKSDEGCGLWRRDEEGTYYECD